MREYSQHRVGAAPKLIHPMRRKYSEKLIRRCQRVMSKRAGFDITEDQAEVFLDQLAKIGNLAMQLWEVYKQKSKQ